MIAAAIDIGTNSIKLHIGERMGDGGWRTLVDRAEVVRLGEGLVQSGEFSVAAMARAGINIEAISGENVGAARLTERYALHDAVSPGILQQALAAINTELARLDTAPAIHTLIGMGGAVITMVAVKLGLAPYNAQAVQGAVLTLDDVNRQIERYRSSSTAERRSIVGLQAGRADVILAGACIVKTVLEKFRLNALTVSDRSLRHGVLIERFPA